MILTGSSFYLSWLQDARFTGANLTDVSLQQTMLDDADLTRANLTDADFASAFLYGANLTDAVVTRAEFVRATNFGFESDQLYSTASYQQKDLRGINLARNDLTGWDFSGQNLANATFAGVCDLDIDEADGVCIETNLRDASSGVVTGKQFFVAKIQMATRSMHECRTCSSIW